MPTEVVFGRAEQPAILNYLCPKPYDGAGFTRVPPRKLVGVCNHITAGRGSVEFYRDFFSTGGERQYDALVDFVIGRDGRIAMLNDPFGTRAPWANGGTDGLEGGGFAFLAKFGHAGINNRLYSTEHEGTADEDWPEAMWTASVALDVWMLDRLKMRWDSCPIHQDYGVSTMLHHGEFTGKGANGLLECAGRYYRLNEDRYVADVRDGLKFYQHVGAPVPTPPPPEPKPPSIYPKGWTEETAEQRFGRFRRFNLDGSVTEHGFNPKGQISLLWLARVKKEGGRAPEAQHWLIVADNDQGPERTRVTRQVLTFENGWVALNPADRAGWKWVI